MKATTAEMVAQALGVTVEQVRQQYKANAIQLRECEQTAIANGGRYRGTTAEQWAKFAAHAEKLSGVQS